MNPLIEIANAYRQDNSCPEGGVVVIGTDESGKQEACGWMNELRNPETWPPGCIAIDKDGKQWVAVDGDDYNGAERWVTKLCESAANIAGFVESELDTIGRRFDEAASEQEHDELFAQYTAYKKVLGFIVHKVQGDSLVKEASCHG